MSNGEKDEVQVELEKEREKERAKLETADSAIFGGLITLINLIGETYINPKKALRKWVVIIPILVIFFLTIRYFMVK
jgi:hypothetical protein